MQLVAPSSRHPCPCGAPLPCLPHRSDLTLILSPSTPLSSRLKSLLPKIPRSATITPLSCQDNSMHDASLVNPVLGTTHHRTCRLLILGLSLPLSYVPYHSFTLNSSALPFFFPSFCLALDIAQHCYRFNPVPAVAPLATIHSFSLSLVTKIS